MFITVPLCWLLKRNRHILEHFYHPQLLIWSLLSTVKDKGCAQKGGEFSRVRLKSSRHLAQAAKLTNAYYLTVPANQWSEMKKIYITPSLSHFFLLIFEVREQNIFSFTKFLQLLKTKQSLTKWSTENSGGMVVVFFTPKHMIPDINHQWKKDRPVLLHF